MYRDYTASRLFPLLFNKLVQTLLKVKRSSDSRFGQNLPPTESIQPENLSPFTSVQWTLSATETND